MAYIFLGDSDQDNYHVCSLFKCCRLTHTRAKKNVFKGTTLYNKRFVNMRYTYAYVSVYASNSL
jgi:hypothetical protein